MIETSEVSRTLTSLLSRTGPEVPPDVAALPAEPTLPAETDPAETPDTGSATAPETGPAETPDAGPDPAETPEPGFRDVPTQQLPLVTAPPSVAARAVIVYEPQPPLRRGLWLFTALLVALTVGVVLGQTSAYQPPSRSTTATVGQPAAATPGPTAPAPSASGTSTPGPPAPGPPAAPVTAPLGTARTAAIELNGTAGAVRISSADLGGLLFSAPATSVAGAAVRDGPQTRVTLAVAGAGAEIQLHAAVRWTIHLTGAVGDLLIDPGTAPVRVKLAGGAGTATLSRVYHDVKPGTALRTAGWRSATKRYDVVASAPLRSVTVAGAPGVSPSRRPPTGPQRRSAAG
ncbi:hypothetical protein [Mangrovihabitans endophyticus]|uniref:Uncharacterized protein n=1 Tax=Mangrovihabitans endophyticus TaxID=1751298 RepID=A0A8J3FM88_9ACTN|nr:hypothetical protein [Mangrovihabitans endophyticus]GGK77665.1 hypothetical protein GCM10012284_09500 [Mangrovihabitans endophyticus]